MEWEGTTFENDPDDPGGATKFGIDQRSHPHVVVKNLTLEDAKVIYWGEWNRELGPILPRPINEVYFNFCVNTGQGRANKFLQIALGVTPDGVVGPHTLGAISAVDPRAASVAMINAADSFYGSLHRPKYLRGWLNRDHALLTFIG